MQQIQVLLCGTFSYFFSTWGLVESDNAGPVDTKGQLCLSEFYHIVHIVLSSRLSFSILLSYVYKYRYPPLYLTGRYTIMC